jgi:hypothetical protein
VHRLCAIPRTCAQVLLAQVPFLQFGKVVQPAASVEDRRCS